MKIKLTSVLVKDQAAAETFYTETLGFVTKNDIPMGSARWLTVVSPEAPEEIELLLEPAGNAAARAYQGALYEEGIPLASFCVDDIQGEYERLKGRGVAFRSAPASAGEATVAVLDDTCGNWIQLYQV